MSVQYAKNKSVGKITYFRGEQLQEKVLKVMAKISSIVGATFGPGGCPVLLERQEEGLPPLITKDGVTVHKYLGFEDSTDHAILESARSAAIRTADEAGDGTTCSTILSEAIVRNMMAYCKANPKFSPQKGVRLLEKTVKERVEPLIKQSATQANFATEDGKKLLKSVATISANGDVELSEAVMECFELTGDDGNVTIIEKPGPSGYFVEKVDGFAINNMGYEECTRRFFPLFINDPARQRVFLEKATVIVYYGTINDLQPIVEIANKIGLDAEANNRTWNVVIAATGFSEGVLGNFSGTFQKEGFLHIYPIIPVKTPALNCEMDFMQDLAAATGTYVFDPIHRPLHTAELEDLGHCKSMESYRFKTILMTEPKEEFLMPRIEALQEYVRTSETALERTLAQERLGRLTGGIARLHVIGSSSGEIREKRDRAEDAVCAVKGAIKHGCLPGGGWTLLKLCDALFSDPSSKELTDEEVFINEVMVESFKTPINVLLTNIGLNEEEIEYVVEKVQAYIYSEKPVVFDALQLKHVDPFETGILDSTPAVLEAIRSAISIASLLGTLGGTVVFPRDHEVERYEAHQNQAYLRALEEGDLMREKQRRGE